MESVVCRPSICCSASFSYFNIIWDEAEELFLLARSSDPRVVIDTSGLPPEYTEFANRLARQICNLDSAEIG